MSNRTIEYYLKYGESHMTIAWQQCELGKSIGKVVGIVTKQESKVYGEDKFVK